MTLRELWRRLWGTPPPPSFAHDLPAGEDWTARRVARRAARDEEERRAAHERLARLQAEIQLRRDLRAAREGER
jgi:hypothetical protein